MTSQNDRIFVFGSNMKGRHGKGAALLAAQRFGARENIGYGPMNSKAGLGQPTCYAIPTKGYDIKPLALSVIQRHIGYFIDYVLFDHRNDAKGFNVTQIGCGLAGYSPKEIAPMFLQLSSDSNSPCWFDPAWKEFLGPNAKFFDPPIT